MSRPGDAKKVGEMDDETCTKGWGDFIIHVTYNRRIPEADSFFPSSWLVFEKYPGRALGPLVNVSRVRFFKLGPGKVNPFHFNKCNMVFYTPTHKQFPYNDKEYFTAIKWWLKNVTKFNKTHFVDYLNHKWIDPSALVEGLMKRLVSALCRAHSSLVGNHLVINNRILEWIRVVADTNGRDKKLPNKRSRLIWSFFFFLYSVTGCHAWHAHTHTRTHTHTVTQTHSRSHTPTHPGQWLNMKHEY